MNDLVRLWNRLLEIISPPKYPEYTEYRDESASSESAHDDDVAIKIRRLRLAACFIVVLCAGVAIYLYNIRDSPGTKTKTREVLAAELMKEVLPEDDAPKPESLEDVKKWAQQMEASVMKDADSAGAHSVGSGGRASQYDVPTNGLRDRGRGDSYADVLSSYGIVSHGLYHREPDHPAVVAGERDTAYDFGSTTGVTASPVPATAGRSTPPAVPQEQEHPAPSPAAQQRAAPTTSGDTPGARYQRRTVEPIVIQPRTVESY